MLDFVLIALFGLVTVGVIWIGTWGWIVSVEKEISLWGGIKFYLFETKRKVTKQLPLCGCCGGAFVIDTIVTASEEGAGGGAETIQEKCLSCYATRQRTTVWGVRAKAKVSYSPWVKANEKEVPPHDAAAFTLIELLVVLAILAIVITLVSATFRAASSGYSEGGSHWWDTPEQATVIELRKANRLKERELEILEEQLRQKRKAERE